MENKIVKINAEMAREAMPEINANVCAIFNKISEKIMYRAQQGEDHIVFGVMTFRASREEIEEIIRMFNKRGFVAALKESSAWWRLEIGW